MRVLVPAYDKQIFITEVVNSYKALFEVDINYDKFWLTEGDYDIIHLHWPEYLFKWEEPTDLEVLLLCRVLQEWRDKGAKIVITRHNYLPHRPNPERFEPLYKTIYTNVDAVIHLGQFSIKEYHIRYNGFIPEKQVQAYIPHPIFTNYPNTISRKEARKYLKIGQKTLVMLVFGAIRTAAEKTLTLKAFNAIDQKDKVLLAPGWKFTDTKEPVNRLKWVQVKNSKKYRITQEFIEDAHVQYYFIAADFVFLPRTDTLNSGVPFLAAVFNTPIVGFQTGNITEILKANGMPVFTHSSSAELTEVIKQVITIGCGQENFVNMFDTSNPLVTGNSHLNLFKSLKNK